MKKFEFSESQAALLPSNPVDRKAVKSAIEEMSGALTRAEAERSYVAETVKDLAEKYEMDKRLIRKLLGSYHKSNKEEVVAQATDLDTAYDALFSPTTKAE